jgi:DnaJ domain
MTIDQPDYYADLGVSSSATAQEIKTVYRALARIYHPDVNRDRAASATFRKITEAYEVLGDPERRKNYDRMFSSKEEEENEDEPESESKITVDPIVCSVCRKVAAQPRYLLFRSVVSIVFMTTRTPKHGVYCVECAKNVSFRSSLISALFGWWGVPWGPIFTIKEILSNAVGGERQLELEENLLWQNTVAFLQREKYELAGSLANFLTKSKNKEIADAANRTLGLLRGQNIAVNKLKNVWKFDVANFSKHLALLCIVPSIIAFFLADPLSFADSRHRYRPLVDTNKTSSLNSKKDQKKVLSENTVEPSPPIDFCKNRPRNGKIFGFGFIPEADGHRLTIKNGSTGDAIVKLRKASSRELVASFFVEKNLSASLDGISDGTYRVQFAFGDAMNANCNSFTSPVASEFDGTQEFVTRRTETQIITRELTFTLFEVANGNARQSRLSQEEFEN